MTSQESSQTRQDPPILLLVALTFDTETHQCLTQMSYPIHIYQIFTKHHINQTYGRLDRQLFIF